MNANSRSSILFRYFLISIGILVLAFLIVQKLVGTTVIHAKKWNELAAVDFSRVDTVQPERGNILAADGSILATNLQYYTVRIDYRTDRFDEKEFLRKLPALADSLAKYFPQKKSAEWEKELKAPLSQPKEKRTRSKKVVANITFSQLEILKTFPFFNMKNRNLNGLVVERNMKRSYPYGMMAKRSIGGVGEQIIGNKTKGEIHGVSGLEMALDSLLYGVPGTEKRITLTDRLGSQTDVPAVRGFDIVTTIDIKMQDIVEHELNHILETADADWGVAILMEVATGEIKAISNLEKSPTTGQYIEGMNRAVLGFEPGSVVKPISMLLALEEGLVSNIDRVIQIGAKYPYAGGRPITDSHFIGETTVKGVIEQSSNIGMTKILCNPEGPFHKNPARFRQKLEEIGFLDPFNMGIAGERIPNIAANPSRISLSRMCFGYATEIPPIYILAAYNAIANDGRFVRPRLVKELIGENFDSILPTTYVREQICSPQNAAKLREMMTAVVWGDHGTARKVLRDDNVRIAGKTGTCNIAENNGYNMGKKRLTFCGFFPAEKPLYSCIVLTSNPKRNLMSAPSSSGQAVKNIATTLYSKGMLDNSSDYRADEDNNPSTPVFYSTTHSTAHKTVRSGLGLRSSKELIPPKKVTAGKGQVPQVVGLGLREAIVALEEKGYNVHFKGSGYVRTQTPAAGAALAKGSKVTLSLTEF